MKLCPDNSSTRHYRYRVKINGQVQGVGFRPFVYREAVKRSLSGWVMNNKQGVILEIEGDNQLLQQFLKKMGDCSLRLARVTDMTVEEVNPAGDSGFIIRTSSGTGKEIARVMPDAAICARCKADVLTPENRRYGYPFTNCTECGPRFTIVKGIPFDREKTTMTSFQMCPECSGEYNDMCDRRFHAQPNACAFCGPGVELLDNAGNRVPGNWQDNFSLFIKSGKIIAVKGLGGFHLACDANNPAAVSLLRVRKRRPLQPLAVMCRDVETARRYCSLNETESELLYSPAAPIVILRRHDNTSLPALSPGTQTLGVMLPYTPLHVLLFENVEMLVMTSANESGVPLIKDNMEALHELSGIADYFVIHNRDIHRRCDDSLAQVVDGEPLLLRRSRGYVPEPFSAPVPAGISPVLGVGGDQKNVFCLLKNGQAYLGPHIGDLSYRETQQVYLESLQGLQELLEIKPETVSCDCHPDYYSGRIASTLSYTCLEQVYHHHAHMASCMAENMLAGPVIAVICDGTGYGNDETVWGGEVLSGGYLDFRREYHIEQIPMPGGEAAIRHPLRMAISYLVHHFGEEGKERANRLFPGCEREVELVCAILKKRINSPLTSSCGRLYDAVSALLGVCFENSYDGQAPLQLAEKAWAENGICYPFSLQNNTIKTGQMFRYLLADLENGAKIPLLAASFQQTVTEMFTAAAVSVREKTGIRQVVLSGGCFQNPYFLSSLSQRLHDEGLEVFRHRLVPTNDGGLALGQAVVAAWRRNDEPCV